LPATLLARSSFGLGLGARLRPCAPRDVGILALSAPAAARDCAVIEPDHVAQLVELLLRQLACVTDAKIVEREVGKRHALELVDLEAERLDHPVDLAVLALVDGDAEPGVLALGGQDLDLGRQRGRAIVERDTVAQRPDELASQLAVDLDVVGLGHMTRRREQPRRELAVVGEQQDALAVEVEAADRLHRDRQVRQIVHHRRPAAIIGHSRDAGLWLVEQDIEVVEGHHGLVIHQHGVVLGIDLGPEDVGDLAVHLHPARHDQLLGLAARGDPGGRKVPLQADRRTHGHSTTGSALSIGEARSRGAEPPVGSIGEARSRGVGTPTAPPAGRGAEPPVG
jgi:hypothetical protein